MRVERWARGDALDLTWAYFWALWRDIPDLIRMESGRGWTREEINAQDIAEQKRRKGREL